MQADLTNTPLEWVLRGRLFEATERGEWDHGDYKASSFQHPVRFAQGRRGRVDILLGEQDGSFSVIEVKATDWDAMADHRVRPNLLRHCRQILKYVYPFWHSGIDICPGLIYPRAPISRDRKDIVESILEERCIQVVWADERISETGESERAG